MTTNFRGFTEVFLLGFAFTGGGIGLAKAQQAAAELELPTVEVVGSASAEGDDGASVAAGVRGAANGRATPSSASPVIDYVATDSRVGTKTDTPLIETPQSITVIGDEQMRDQGVQNVQEALRYTPGVLGGAFGVDTRSDYNYIRGIPATYFIDGLRSSFGYTYTIPIEPYALERVEVLRGPASMLYGQAPVGGIVNGVSKLPLATPRNEVTVEYGSFDFKQFKFDSSGPLTQDGKWLYRVVGLARDADTQVDYVGDDRLMIAPSLTYRPTDDTSITLLANIRDDKTGSTQQFLPARGTLTPNAYGQRANFSTFVGEPGDYYNTRQQSLEMLLDHRFNESLKLHSVTRYTHTENDYQSTYAAVMTPSRVAVFNALLGGPIFNPAYAPYLNAGQSQIARAVTKQNTDTGVLASDTYLSGTFQTGIFEHKLTGGIDYTRFAMDLETAGTLVDNALPGQPRFDIYAPLYGQSTYLYSLSGGIVSPYAIPMSAQPHEVQSDVGLYLQDQIKAGPWRAVLGLRQDWLTIEQDGSPSDNMSATSSRLALMYETDFGLAPYASYSTSFTPQPGALVGSSIFATAYGEALTPAKPLQGEQVEIGFKYEHPTLPLAVNGSLYELTQRNAIVQPDFLFDAVGGADIKVRGFEIDVTGKILPELKMIASYSYTDATYDRYPELYPYASGISEFMQGKPVSGIPKNLASLWGVYTAQGGAMKGWSVGGGVRYVGASQSFGRDVATQQALYVRTPAYTLFDAMLAWENEDWRWQLNAQNLANTFYVVSCTAYRGDCAIGQARTVITSLTYKF